MPGTCDGIEADDGRPVGKDADYVGTATVPSSTVVRLLNQDLPKNVNASRSTRVVPMRGDTR